MKDPGKVENERGGNLSKKRRRTEKRRKFQQTRGKKLLQRKSCSMHKIPPQTTNQKKQRGAKIGQQERGRDIRGWGNNCHSGEGLRRKRSIKKNVRKLRGKCLV